jgi:NAD(P)-dependent dehydrogenase (short-subunit alcohol dehydrogenase family)
VLEPGSAIVATASLAGLVPSTDDPLYTLTKHGVVGFVRAVAPQLEARGLRICAVAPGFADTPLLDGETRAAFEAARFPLLHPGEVANAVLRVAREARSGEVWVVQPGSEPVPFRFPNVPGARRPDGTTAPPPA